MLKSPSRRIATSNALPVAMFVACNFFASNSIGMSIRFSLCVVAVVSELSFGPLTAGGHRSCAEH